MPSEQKTNLICIKIVCKNKNFCNVIILPEDTKVLGFNQHQKYDKAPFIIYADLKYIIEKIDGCKNNPKNSSTTKVRNIFHQVFQYHNLEAQKISMMYTEVKIV